jgi:hypothetical protein
MVGDAEDVEYNDKEDYGHNATGDSCACNLLFFLL